VRERTDFTVQNDIFGTTRRRRTLFDAYWLTPMVENAFREATSLPIVQGGDDSQ
jgi:hypothetical protein